MLFRNLLMYVQVLGIQCFQCTLRIWTVNNFQLDAYIH